MKLFDTHCHIADEDFDADRGEVLSRMREYGVEKAVVIGDMSLNPERTLNLAREVDFIYAAFGLHPHEAKSWSGAIREKLSELLSDKKTVALGETGLDYHYDLSPRDVQRDVFDAQLDMALERKLPAILHIREAHGDATDMLKQRYSKGNLPGCVMHCFSGSWPSAKAYIDMGMYISFTGVITFKNARKLVEVAEKMPLDRLMIETDCPYMAPVPMRGSRNEPCFVRFVAEQIARIRGMDADELALAAFENGKRFFNIS